MYKTFRGHAVRVVELRVWKRTNVILVLSTVKEMREVTLLKLCETKRFREGGEFHWDETLRVYNLMFISDTVRERIFATRVIISGVIYTVLIEVLKNEVPVVSMEIMRDKRRIGVFLLKYPCAELVFSV